MGDPTKRFKRFLIRLLQDTEDDLSQDGIYKIELRPHDNPATLNELRDNHMYHLALAVNGLHIRVGRLEAKTGLILAVCFGILGIAIKPVVAPLVEQLVRAAF